MKIGLVLFGHLRSYRKTLSSFNSLKETLQRSGDVDVFCHTWDIEESLTASWWKEHKAGDILQARVNTNELEVSYNPVRYIVEPSRQFDDSGYSIRSSMPVAGILSMLHSQQQAFGALEQYELEKGFRYDVILKARYDLVYEIAPSFPGIIKECIADNCLFLPTSNPYELSGSFSDIFVLGPRKLVKEYFDFVTNFKTAAGHYQQKGYKEFLPELCLTEFLKWKNVHIKDLIGLRIHILRMNGDKFQINTEKNFSDNKPLCFFRDTIETNKKIFSVNDVTVANNTPILVKKFMSWVDKEADAETLRQYADLYSGKWIGTANIKRLASKSKNNFVFSSNVMKNFFEEAMRNAKYGQVKKVLLASILAAWSGYGSFFFRVLKKITFDRS